MGWREDFVEEYAGPPLRVALNLYIAAAAGILLAHFGFGVQVNERVITGAMLPGFVAVAVAIWMRISKTRR